MANLSADRPMDFVSKRLIITLISPLIGAMVAIGADPGAVHYGYLAWPSSGCSPPTGRTT